MYSPNLYSRFVDIATRYPDASALCFQGVTLLYSELQKRAEQGAGVLFDYGVTPGEVVCICAEKNPDVYALLLGCLAAGTPYVMLDPRSPVERQRRIIQRCRPRILFFNDKNSENDLVGMVEEFQAKVLPLKILDDPAIASRRKSLVLPSVTASHPAYIMFTSGSTGFPKGAVMSHQNVLRLIAWSQSRFGFGPGEILTNVNPLFFDNSVFDIYSSLFTGAALAPFTWEEVRSPLMLLNGVAERGCTSWFSVPSLLIYLDTMKALQPEVMPRIKRYIFGGEGYPMARLKRLFDMFGSRAEIVNVYGPTECSCICSAYNLTEPDFEDLRGFPPLGSLTPEFSALIIGEDGQPVNEGEWGELVLYGPCVGRGYYNDQERTADAFIQHPTHDLYREIVYRTGDIVRRDPVDGRLWISGRKDYQIKHMGYRIELEEIESALCAVPGVCQSVCVHGTRYGNSCIAAVLCAEPGLDEHVVRLRLQEHLPAYMIPSEIHFVSELPRNQNGKIDRKGVRDEVFQM